MFCFTQKEIMNIVSEVIHSLGIMQMKAGFYESFDSGNIHLFILCLCYIKAMSLN
jgi:hypothetical protein